jgi:hypothetical protein
MFNIEFEKFYKLLLPVFTRTYSTLLAIIQACVEPLSTLHIRLLLYRNGTAQTMSYSSQTCRLRGMLNDLYDPEQRRITVNATVNLEYLYIYTVAEVLPVMVAQVAVDAPTMINRTEAIGSDGDFDVNLPANTYNDEQVSRIRASIDQHKLATRYYRII